MKQSHPYLQVFVIVFLHSTDCLYKEAFPNDDEKFTCNYFCPADTNRTEWYLPPKFEQPCTPKDIQSIYYTKQGNDYAVIKWTEPTATDRNGDIPNVENVVGGVNGGNFLGTIFGTTHRVVYIATDKDGLTDNCFFNFTVIVPSCPKLPVVQNGIYTCTKSTAQGSSCVVSCEEGFKQSGSGNATCGYSSKRNRFLTWKNVQRCEKIKCGTPNAPHNADTTCSDIDYSFQTVCEVSCDRGFFSVGPLYTICEASGNWSKPTVCTKQNPDDTHCSSSLCNGHSCIQHYNDTYTCKCYYGWSGTTCKIQPNYCSESICKNGATCSSQNATYECKCPSGYFGSICQHSPNDGHWSDWSLWSKCSVTCGSGMQTRHRSCNNPPPDQFGKICYGSYTEVKGCSETICKVCPEFKQINESLTYSDCKTDQTTGLLTCVVICMNGTMRTPWFEDFEMHRCGWQTNYSWVPGNIQASCVVPVAPEELRLDTEITYKTIIPKEDHTFVKNQVTENVKETSCIQSTQCNTTITLSPTEVENTKKTKLKMSFRRYLKDPGKNASYDEAVKEEITTAILQLESTAEYLKNATSDIFNVRSINGTYNVDESSLNVEGFVGCSTGQIPVNGLCIECPVGTYTRDNICIFCPKGTFQALTGQTSCLMCPSGTTTYSVGSVYEQQCFEYSRGNTEDPLSEGRSIAIIIGPVVALVVAIPSFVAGVWKIRKYCKERNSLESKLGGHIFVVIFGVTERDTQTEEESSRPPAYSESEDVDF